MTSKEEILKDVKKVAENTEGYLSLNKYREKGNLGNKIFNQFDKWNEIKKELGLPTKKQTVIKDNLEELKEMVEEGLPSKEIAKELGVSRNYVNTVLTDKLNVKRRNSVTPTINNVTGNERIQFNFLADLLEKAGIDQYKELEKIFYDVETDEENHRIIINLGKSRYKQPDE